MNGSSPDYAPFLYGMAPSEHELRFNLLYPDGKRMALIYVETPDEAEVMELTWRLQILAGKSDIQVLRIEKDWSESELPGIPAKRVR